MEKEELLYIINQNGEILREIGTDYERISKNTIIIKPNVAYRDELKIDYSYVKLNSKVGTIVYKECPQILLLLPYLEYKTNFLMFSNGVYINQTNFAKRTGLSRVYVCELFKKFKKMEILKAVKVNGKNVYMLNPYIAMKGNRIYTDLIGNFKDTKWKKLQKERENNE